MKKHFLLVFVLLTFTSQAQINLQDDLSSIIESETKAALNSVQGSRNLNTGNYDLTYHRLEFEVDPGIAFISGDVTSYFIAKENMDEVTFELSDNMVVSEVLQRGNSLSFIQNSDDEVVITLPQTQNQGVLDSLTISYSGNPVSSGFGSFEQSSHNGHPVIWTLSEPYGAKGWWPCKQDLNDKIDIVDFFITTPVEDPMNDEYIVAANGVELGQEINGAFKTTHYRHQYPIPAYLIAFAVTNYDVYSHTVDNNGNPFDIVNYVYPEDINYAQANTGVTVDIMNLFSDLFEEYPYAEEKYGHAQFGWGGGMEHTTVSFMGSFSRGLIAHELAHQWFGDKITCGSWQDIWLNEGFATYLAALVIEDLDGEASFKSWRTDAVNYITSQPDGSVYVPAQDTLSVGRVFSSRLSYNKGAMVLHMLRRKLDNGPFYQGLQAYLSNTDLAFDYAKTPDLQAILEDTSGEDLEEFFNDWVYGEGYPSYQLEWGRINANQIEITLNQTQSHNSVSFFEATVPIKIFGTGGEEEIMLLENNSNGEQFVLDIAYEIGLIVIDHNRHLISRNNTVTLGISDLELAESFIIYPNPASSHFTIRKPNDISLESIEIYDVLGRKVMTPDIQETISVEALAKGLHFVKFKTDRGSLVKKLLIE